MLEAYFLPFREKIIGINQTFKTPFGLKKIIYADWIASGRLYQDIEDNLLNNFYPFVGNTHTLTTITGSCMTTAYHEALYIIKKHVNANQQDVIITAGSGMTAVINKFQRILGLKIHEKFQDIVNLPKNERPVVFVTHMEHHSNQTSWLETIADVIVIKATNEGLVDVENLVYLLDEYKNRPLKIAAITSCSNVTGIFTPYHQIAALMHQNGGLCFVDFACSAPYIDIDMHPSNTEEKLDAIYFSPHKFLGGPGTSGVLIFDNNLYNNRVPDAPGGGTVNWTNPWGEQDYVSDIEAREDGGTPGFLQAIRIALAIKLKEKITVRKMLAREEELLDKVWQKLLPIKTLHILAENQQERLGVISFYIDDLHYNLVVKILNDKFGIQTRGGCSCAGTYGHYLLHVTEDISDRITCEISKGNLSAKPGWVRMSLHPTMKNDEIDYILNAIIDITNNHKELASNYTYNPKTNDFSFKNFDETKVEKMVAAWLTKN